MFFLIGKVHVAYLCCFASLSAWHNGACVDEEDIKCFVFRETFLNFHGSKSQWSFWCVLCAMTLRIYLSNLEIWRVTFYANWDWRSQESLDMQLMWRQCWIHYLPWIKYIYKQYCDSNFRFEQSEDVCCSRPRWFWWRWRRRRARARTLGGDTENNFHQLGNAAVQT